MYIPKMYEEHRIPVLHELIEANPFASLITMGSSGLFASHIPMVLEKDGSSLGRLKCHVSRANAQWRDFSPEVEALAIFAGNHHYISPTWYVEKEETGKVVPTWNYEVVHVYGKLKAIEDHDWLMAHLNSLTNIHEAASPEPWKVSDAPPDYIEAMAKGVVGFELSIQRFEGKWKVSQNRNERDREGIYKGLDHLNTETSKAMKKLVQTRCPFPE
jgi:transcriptional regulator